MAVIEERGLFWWATEPIQKNHFAPEASLGGFLRIDDNGAIDLELDGCMPSENGPLVALTGPHRRDIPNIQGVLKTSNDYVLICQPLQNGVRIRSNGISFEKYIAHDCLVGPAVLPVNPRNQKFRSIRINLVGLEEFMRLGAIRVNRRKSSLSAKYKNDKKIVYPTVAGTLAIHFDLRGPFWGESRHHELKLAELAYAVFTPKTKCTLEECQKYYQMIEELLILLTNSDYNLDWPTLTTADGRRKYRLYFMRNKSSATAPRAHECLTNFLQLRTDFGELFSSWLMKREQFGPGFYLYLGTRRGVRLYSEHRFVNLIWGLEAFDRSTRGEGAIQPRLQKKIDRILDGVILDKDKQWLARRLEHAAEPKLQNRLVETLSRVPIPLEEEALSKFCEQCAKRRNDISHYGGFRRGTDSYSAFLQDLEKKSDALSALYHLLLLTEIGIKPSLLDFQKNGSRSSNEMEYYLHAAGLLMRESARPT